MPSANKYSVLTTNRFQLADSDGSSGSEDESCQNVDPYAMVKQAEVEAIKQAKIRVKEASKVKVPVLVKEEAKQENQVDTRKNTRREPRGNQAPRRGPRNERIQDNDNALSENNNQPARDDNDKRQRRPKTQDRRSGNPRAGVKAVEKKGGHGAGNWGKATEKPGDFEEKPESVTPEAENTENADPEKKEAEEETPAEEEEITLTLEEYYAQATTLEDDKSASTRKANDGEQLKGKVIRKNKIFTERKQTAAARDPNTNKVVVPNEQLAFVSGRRGNYRYQDNNNNTGGDRRQGGKRNFDNKQGNRGERSGDKSKPDFSKPSNDFPELGK